MNYRTRKRAEIKSKRLLNHDETGMCVAREIDEHMKEQDYND